MNFIAGNLLKLLNEQESFWLFTSIAENILPLDYYSDMLGILVDQKIFEELLTERHPKLVAHMQNNHYQLDLIAFQWLVTLFFNSLQHESEVFVLTAFLLKGQKIIIKIALLIVEYFKDAVMRCKSFDEIYCIIAKEPYEQITPTVLCKLFEDHKKIKFTNKMLEHMREKVRPEIIKGIQESFFFQDIKPAYNQDTRIKFLNQFSVYNGLNKFYEQALNAHKLGTHVLDDKTLKEYQDNGALINSNLDNRYHEVMRVFDCNQEWPICIYDFTFKNQSTQFLVMKCKRSLSSYVIDDYFGPKKVNSKIKRPALKESEFDILREQMFHLCCCQHDQSQKEKDKIYRFIRNFKILFIKADDFLFKNKNLKFLLDSDTDI